MTTALEQNTTTTTPLCDILSILTHLPLLPSYHNSPSSTCSLLTREHRNSATTPLCHDCPLATTPSTTVHDCSSTTNSPGRLLRSDLLDRGGDSGAAERSVQLGRGDGRPTVALRGRPVSPVCQRDLRRRHRRLPQAERQRRENHEDAPRNYEEHQQLLSPGALRGAGLEHGPPLDAQFLDQGGQLVDSCGFGVD